jgi:hypothetical protein
MAEDPQRKQLQQLTTLCIECAQDEQKIETDHEQQLADHQQRIQYARTQNEEKHQKNLAAIDQRRDEKFARLEERYATDSANLEGKTREARQTIENNKLATDEQIKKLETELAAAQAKVDERKKQLATAARKELSQEQQRERQVATAARQRALERAQRADQTAADAYWATAKP